MTIHSSSKVSEDDAETGCELLLCSRILHISCCQTSNSFSASDLDSDFALFRQISIITFNTVSTS